MMGDESLDMNMNVYMGQDFGIRLMTQANETTGKTIIIVQVLAE